MQDQKIPPWSLAGLSPLRTATSPGSAFALFALDREGLYLLEVTGGGTAGAYSLRLFVAGDVNADGNVDGLDGELLSAAVGTSVGQPGYVVAADGDRDDRLSSEERQALRAKESDLRRQEYAVEGRRRAWLFAKVGAKECGLPALPPGGQLVFLTMHEGEGLSPVSLGGE